MEPIEAVWAKRENQAQIQMECKVINDKMEKLRSQIAQLKYKIHDKKWDLGNILTPDERTRTERLIARCEKKKALMNQPAQLSFIGV